MCLSRASLTKWWPLPPNVHPSVIDHAGNMHIHSFLFSPFSMIEHKKWFVGIIFFQFFYDPILMIFGPLQFLFPMPWRNDSATRMHCSQSEIRNVIHVLFGSMTHGHLTAILLTHLLFIHTLFWILTLSQKNFHRRFPSSKLAWSCNPAACGLELWNFCPRVFSYDLEGGRIHDYCVKNIDITLAILKFCTS